MAASARIQLTQLKELSYRLETAKAATTPATAFARSSCAPGAWSMLSRPPRAVRRSKPTICAMRRAIVEQIDLAD